ncbi:hypothetical protein JOB18_029952, partial [Solea senegalensis]
MCTGSLQWPEPSVVHPASSQLALAPEIKRHIVERRSTLASSSSMSIKVMLIDSGVVHLQHHPLTAADHWLMGLINLTRAHQSTPQPLFGWLCSSSTQTK